MITSEELERRKAICRECRELRTHHGAVVWCSRRQIKPGTRKICLPWAANEYRKLMLDETENGGCPKWHEKMDDKQDATKGLDFEALPLSGPLSTPVFVVTSVYSNPNLAVHFLRHYAQMGVTQILLSVRSSDCYDSLLPHANRYPAKVVHTPAEFFADSDKATVQETLLNRAGVRDDDYVMRPDLDEFADFPSPLNEIIGRMNATNCWAIRAWMVDRVAADGRLPPVRLEPSICEQFPILADVTNQIVRGWTQKIPLCRGRVRLKGGCAHDTWNATYDTVPIGSPNQYITNHFKWTAGILEVLKTRLTQPGTNEGYKRECRRFIEHYEKHGRIKLEAIKSRHAGGPLKGREL